MQQAQPHICVFASSSVKLEQLHYQFAHALGEELGKQGCALVFGGGRVGLMGACADGVLHNDGRVIGVIPALLNQPGIPHLGCHELIETPTMHIRKETMEHMADAFISLPGGFGTLEELLEVITLKQLGYHQKPIVICNVGGYYDALLEQFETGFATGFANIAYETLYCVAYTPIEAVTLALTPSVESHLPDKMADSREAANDPFNEVLS